MSKKLKKRVPELRFFEFEGSCDWKQNKLKNITQKIGSGATPIGGDSNYKESGISLFRSLNVYDGLFKSKNLAFIDENQAKILDNVTVKKGDILFNITGASIARCCIAPTELLPARVNQHVMIIRPNPKDIKTEFLALILIHHTYKKKLFQLGGKGGSTREALTKEHIEQFEILYPSIAEQEKIASLLGAVDRRLTQLRRKQELLQTYKRGVMQKIFSQKIRFKGAIGSEFPDWEQKKLGDIADTDQPYSFTGGPFGSDLKSSDYRSDGIRVIQLQNIGDGYFLNDYQIFTSEAKANQLISCNIYPSDILLSKMGDPVARACIVPNHHERYLMCSDGIRLGVNKKLFNTYFIYSFLNAPVFRKSAENASSGSTRKRIGLTNLRSLKLACPVLEEQEKIANFLTAIDRKIETLSRKIDQTEQFKKGLLQKMFV